MISTDTPLPGVSAAELADPRLLMARLEAEREERAALRARAVIDPDYLTLHPWVDRHFIEVDERFRHPVLLMLATIEKYLRGRTELVSMLWIAVTDSTITERTSLRFLVALDQSLPPAEHEALNALLTQRLGEIVTRYAIMHPGADTAGRKRLPPAGTDAARRAAADAAPAEAPVRPAAGNNPFPDDWDVGRPAEAVTPAATHQVFPQGFERRLGVLIVDSERDTAGRLKGLRERLRQAGGEAPRALRTMADVEAFMTRLVPARYPNFTCFFAWLRAQLTLVARHGDQVVSLPPVLLVGPPGVGKTVVLRRLAEALDTPFLSLDMAAQQSGSRLSGSQLFWNNARAGDLFNELAMGRAANPIVLLDEIDKINPHSQFSPASALYTLLERRTARSFEDLFLPGIPLDASRVLWFATANSTTGMDGALLSRFRVLHIPAPSREEMPVVCQSVYADLRAEASWGHAFPAQLDEAVIARLTQVSPRGLARTLEAAFGLAALAGRDHLTPDDLSGDDLGRRPGLGFTAPLT